MSILPVTPNIQSKIENYIGSFSNVDALNQWLTEGIVTLLDLMPSEKLGILATDESCIPNAPVSIAGKKIYKCVCGLYNAPLVDARLSPKVIDTNSIYYATVTSPVSIIQNGKIQIYPNGTVYSVAYPTTSDVTLENIANFIREYEPGVILFTAIKAQLSKINSTMILPTMDVEGVTKPTPPSAPSFTYTNAVLGSYVTQVIGDLGTVPSFTIPTNTIDFTISGLVDATEDTELATVQIGKLNSQINKLQSDIQANVQSFNASANAYTLNLTKLTENAKLAQANISAQAEKSTDLDIINEAKNLDKQVEQYKAQLELFQANLSGYQTLITGLVQTYYYDVQNYAIREKALMELLMSLKGEYSEFLHLHLGVATQQANQ